MYIRQVQKQKQSTPVNIGMTQLRVSRDILCIIHNHAVITTLYTGVRSSEYVNLQQCSNIHGLRGTTQNVYIEHT